MDTVTVTSSAPVELLPASGTARWVAIAVENAPIRIQYDGGDGSGLSSSEGELMEVGDKLGLEGAPAANAIYAIGIGLNSRVTVQTGNVA